MKTIYVIREDNEVITARNSMGNAIATVINRIAVFGYQCEKFEYDESITTIEYRDFDVHETRTMVIEAINYMEGI